MAYQVLARKYRPQRFSDVAGQDHVTRTLLNALALGRVAHGYIFSGHRGIGKTTIARILAMALNCRTAIGTAGPDGTVLRPSAEPCGVCESCTEIRAGNAVDVIEIDAATNRGIDEIRELRDAARYRPARDRYKVYILDEAHQITDAAFNALLKTLEEPPDHVVFIMATTQAEDIPQTIRSRCQHFSFHAVKFDDILLQLRTIAAEEHIGAEDEALALLAEAGDGSMRDALSIMDQAIASAPAAGGQANLDAGQIRELMGAVPNSVFERLLEAIGENQSGPVVEEINRLLNAGNSASQLARQFVRYLRNVLMARIAGAGSELLQLSPDERARAGRSALLFSEEDLTRFLQVMLRTFDELNYRQEPRFHLELGLLKLVHLQRLLPVEQLLSQLGAPPAAARRLSGASSELPLGAAGSAPANLSARKPAGSGSLAASSNELAPRAEAPQERPPFSPFEADSRRKSNETGATTVRPVPTEVLAERAGDAPASLPAEPKAAPIIAQTPLPTEASSAQGMEEDQELGQLQHQDPAMTSNALHPVAPVLVPALVPAGGAVKRADPGTAQPPPPLGSPVEGEDDDRHLDDGDLDAAQARVCEALDNAGHNTAAALLANGRWTDEEGGIRVEVAAKKTMLGLTMNAEAEKICREALRSLAGSGKSRTLTVVPAANGAAPPANGALKRPASAPRGGSVQAAAMDNPLVKQAQELFRAEVRSVLDLRPKEGS